MRHGFRWRRNAPGPDSGTVSALRATGHAAPSPGGSKRGTRGPHPSGGGTAHGGGGVSFPLLLKLTVYGVALNALAAVYLSDLLAGPTLVAVAMTMGVSWWIDHLRPSIPNYRRLWDLITVVFLVYLALDFTLLADSFLSAVGHLLLFLLTYKLYNARNHRDLLDVFLLTFLMLVSASLLTTSFGFLLVFCL
ncbi:MAG: DUF3488 domain-containing protein, partial [Zetaproteobacteria bacterium]